MSSVSLMSKTIPEKAWLGHVIHFRILHALNFSGIAEDEIVKFCARVGPRSVWWQTACPEIGVGKVTRRLTFWQISVTVLKTVQDRYTYNRRLIGHRIWFIKWRQRQWPWMTLKVIHRLQAFSNAIRRTFVQHSTRFQLTVCSHGSSALEVLLFWTGELTQFLSYMSIIFTRTWLRYVRIFAVAIPSVCLSVCLSSVTLVHPTQEVEPFGKISSPLCTLAILWPPCKILRRSSQGNPSVGALNARGVSK